MANLNNLKELMDSVLSLIGSVAKASLSGEKMQDAMRQEMGCFAMCVAASGKQISLKKALIVSEITDRNLTPDDIAQIVKEKSLLSSRFLRKVPSAFRMLVLFDRKMKRLSSETHRCTSDSLLSVYKKIGELIMQCSEQTDKPEMGIYRIYIKTLEEFQKEQLNVPEKDKQSDAASEQEKEEKAMPEKKIVVNDALKKALAQLVALCEHGSDHKLSDFSTVIETKMEIRKELLDFLSFLSVSDLSVSEYEAQFISLYTSVTMTKTELSDYITEKDIYSDKFEKRAPDILIKLIEQDNDTFVLDNLKASAGEAYIQVFESFGKEFIVCDGEADESEVDDLTKYIANLREYKNNNALFPEDVPSAIDVSKIHAGETDSEKAEALNELMRELNDMIGLQNVKNDVTSLVHLQQIRRLRKERGLKDIPISNHLVFYGNPGTGKTTVARLLARIYHAMGILSTGQFVETDRSALVAGYVGQTALKTQEVIERSLGGVLLIDEAYALASSNLEGDYGQEVIDTLIKAMEDHRDDFIVIVAGYPELMTHFIESNPGLRSRFNKYINFEDYNEKELFLIFKNMCDKAGYVPTKEALQYTASEFERRYRNRGKNFANARDVRNYFEKAMVKQADRLFSIKSPSDKQLCELTLADVEGIG